MIFLITHRRAILLASLAVYLAGRYARRMDLSWLDVAVGKEMGYTPGRFHE